MKRAKFSVQPCDIRGAQPTGDNCPTARSIRRTLQTDKYVAVWTGRILIGANAYEAPGIVNRAESIFADTGRMTPFEFILTQTKVEADPPRK